MTFNGWLQILIFATIIFIITKPLGIYMFHVFEGERQPLPRFFGPLRGDLQLCGWIPSNKAVHTIALLVFSAVTLLVTHGIERHNTFCR
jgi:K+-transporting ATPase ATPase A chain